MTNRERRAVQELLALLDRTWSISEDCILMAHKAVTEPASDADRAAMDA